jgi:Glycosyl transferase family 2
MLCTKCTATLLCRCQTACYAKEKGGKDPPRTPADPEDMAGKSGEPTTAPNAITRAEVLCRTLSARRMDQGSVTSLLDAVVCEDGKLRVFFGAGTSPAAFHPDGGPDCALPEELRDVSGGCLFISRTAAATRLALAGKPALSITATPAETALFAGQNTIFAFRWDETADQVAESLAYHALHHGLQAALIVNRAPAEDTLIFARILEAALQGCAVRVVLLDCPLPLGKPDTAAENTPYLAPDAPGRDRMAVPDPDPWRAPLGEAVIFEVAKWRFLADARAVLTLDVSDILAPRPKGAPTAFDQCTTAKSGVVLLAGHRIYPWRVRAGKNASFADHICRAFDARRGVARWGAAPRLAGLENTWRQVRVAFAQPDLNATLPFLRAMAIRVPGRATSELVPKTALIEDSALLDLAQDLFGGKPIRAPVSQAKPAQTRPMTRTAIVTTMKNEGPFILEWLAYHRAIGVDDFLIYTNDCSDGTDAMLDLLQAKGLVQHRDNPYRSSGLKPQHAALQAAEDEPIMQTCAWGICMDVDEFINIKIGDGTLPALYAAMGAANMISLTWRLFGNAEIQTYQDAFLTQQFTRCAPEVIRKPHQAWGFKTLFRNIDIYKKLGVHRPKGLRPDLWDQVHWLNGSGKPMPREMFRNGWRSTLETYGYDWVSLNHYAVRSTESFLVKRDRGRVNHVDRDQGLNYWFRMNHNVQEDTSIMRMLPALQAEYQRLLADPQIAAAHALCVTHHQTRIGDLRANETQAAFYAELTSPRMERLCRLQPHFGSAIFAAGPAVIPDDILNRDLAPDFFFTVAADTPADTPADSEADQL